MKPSTPITILMVDDDMDDRDMVREVFSLHGGSIDFHEAGNGEEMLDYLRHAGRYAAAGGTPRPKLIILDLNMPRLDGREALGRLKEDPDLRAIPVVVLTTSDSMDDVRRSYDLGASSYLIKPATYTGLADAINRFCQYWLGVVALP
jgi:CheY-like chemotaxis protein